MQYPQIMLCQEPLKIYGKLLNRKNYYFVPFKQDNPITKPNSVVFDPTYIIRTLEYALDKEQIQPIML